MNVALFASQLLATNVASGTSPGLAADAQVGSLGSHLFAGLLGALCGVWRDHEGSATGEDSSALSAQALVGVADPAALPVALVQQAPGKQGRAKLPEGASDPLTVAKVGGAQDQPRLGNVATILERLGAPPPPEPTDRLTVSRAERPVVPASLREMPAALPQGAIAGEVASAIRHAADPVTSAEEGGLPQRVGQDATIVRQDDAFSAVLEDTPRGIGRAPFDPSTLLSAVSLSNRKLRDRPESVPTGQKEIRRAPFDMLRARLESVPTGPERMGRARTVAIASMARRRLESAPTGQKEIRGAADSAPTVQAETDRAVKSAVAAQEGIGRAPESAPTGQEGMGRTVKSAVAAQEGIGRAPESAPTGQEGMGRTVKSAVAAQEGIGRAPESAPAGQEEMRRVRTVPIAAMARRRLESAPTVQEGMGRAPFDPSTLLRARPESAPTRHEAMGQKGVYEVPVAANAAAGRGRPVPRASAPSDIAVRQATPVHLPAVWNVLHQAAGPDRTVGRAEAWAVAPPPMTLGQLPAQEPDEADLGLETSSVARQTGGARAGRAALGVQEWPSQPAAATPQPQIGRPPEGISRSDGTARPSLVAEAGVTQPGPDLREAANARPPVPAAPSGEWLTSRPAQAPSPLPAMQPESKELAPDLRVATSPTPPTIRTHQAPEPTGPPWPGAARQAHLSAGEPLTSGTGSGRHRAGTESRATTPPSRLEAAQRPSPDRNTADATERRGGNARATEPQGTGLQHVSLTSAAGAVELRRETPLLAVERTERIAEVVGRAAVEGPHRVEVSLNWEDIGVTRVTVEVAKARARVEVTCASAESASTIRALEQPIRERLASEGLQLQDFRAGHDGEQGRGLWQPREPWNAPHDDSHAPSWPTRPMRPGRALAQPTWQAFARASDGRLDVFV